MEVKEKTRNEFAGDDVCNTSVLLSARMREELERSARGHERSVSGEIRSALRSWLRQGDEDEA